MPIKTTSLLALDVGERRIGVAAANEEVRFASPLITLEHSVSVIADIRRLIEQHDAGVLVVGLPRGLDGQETKQTKVVRVFAEKLEEQLTVPVVLQDEALTSAKAETELNARGETYSPGDVDALAATYILEDYIADNLKKG